MMMIGGLNQWLAVCVTCTLLAASGCLDVQKEAQSKSPATVSQSPGKAASEAAVGGGTNKAGNKSSDDGSAQSFPYMQEVMATGLNVPWDMAFAPDGRIFVTERGGTIRVIEQGKLRAEPVFSFEEPSLYNESEAGLLGMALDPNYNTNHYMYVYHTYQEGGQARNRLVRMVENHGKAKMDKVMLDALPGNRIHDGGRVKFGPDGLLYVTSGDASQTSLAQDAAQLGGKILRIAPDGTIPADNPIPQSPVYSLGHRNPQGLAWHPDTRKLFSSEHGQTAHDEINLIEPGANYGWPLIQGDETQVTAKDAGKQGPGQLMPPLVHSGDVTWAPSGITFITKGPWKGNLLAANLRGMQLQRIILGSDRQSVREVQPLFKGEFGRIRNVAEGPDGSIYLMTNNRDGRGQPGVEDDRIIRLKPAF